MNKTLIKKKDTQKEKSESSGIQIQDKGIFHQDFDLSRYFRIYQKDYSMLARIPYSMSDQSKGSEISYFS